MLTPGQVELLQKMGQRNCDATGRKGEQHGSIWRICSSFSGRVSCGICSHIGPRRRRRVPKMACRPLAAGRGARRLAQDLRRGDARGRARSDVARSRPAGPRGRATARTGRVRADAGGLHQGGEHRAHGGAGKETRRRPRAHACRDRAAIRRAGQRAARDLGPRDRLRHLQAAEERHHRARHPGLLRAAQGHVPAGAPLRAQDAGGGTRQARGLAQLLGRRHGADPVPALRVLQIRGRLRWRRQEGHLDVDSRCTRLRRAATGRQGLAARHALGL